jgi:hypothetical protein
MVGARTVAPTVRSEQLVTRQAHAPPPLRGARVTCRVGVDLAPALLDGFNRGFFGFCDVDGAGGGLVEEILGVLPQRTVLDGDYLQEGGLALGRGGRGTGGLAVVEEGRGGSTCEPSLHVLVGAHPLNLPQQASDEIHRAC